MLPPSAVVFDLDGTLVDSRGDIVAAMNHALLRSGHQPLSAPSIVAHVGDGARTLCARCARMPESSLAVDALLADFLEFYTAHPVEFSRWMPGARQVLDSLADRGLPLGVCTNKPRVTTDAVLTALGVRTRFRAVVAGDDLSEKKPAPGPLLRAAALLGQPPERVVMVGDGPQDVECARRAGARAVAVENGFSTRARLLDAKPDVLLGSLAELTEVIDRWRESTVRATIRDRK